MVSSNEGFRAGSLAILVLDNLRLMLNEGTLRLCIIRTASCRTYIAYKHLTGSICPSHSLPSPV